METRDSSYVHLEVMEFAAVIDVVTVVPFEIVHVRSLASFLGRFFKFRLVRDGWSGLSLI